MELKDLKSLIKLVTDTDITEFKMENEDEKILIKRGQEKEIIQVAAPAAAPVAVAPAAPVAAPAAAPASAEPAAAAVDDERYDKVVSPIVGTVYHKPSPDAEPFVQVGTIVEPGQTFCLVEAMKLFNEIEAEYKCKVVEVLKADATPVEYGEALFLVERI